MGVQIQVKIIMPSFVLIHMHRLTTGASHSLARSIAQSI